MLPKDCYNIEEVPTDLMIALDHATRILGWQEHLSEDEMPERWKWHLDWELEEHFERVKIERKEKYGTTSSDDDDEPEFEENAYSPRFR